MTQRLSKSLSRDLIHFGFQEFYRFLKLPSFQNNDIMEPSLIFDWKIQNWDEDDAGMYFPEENKIEILIHEGVTRHHLVRIIFHELIHWRNWRYEWHGSLFKETYVQAAKEAFGFYDLDINEKNISLLDWEFFLIYFLEEYYDSPY